MNKINTNEYEIIKEMFAYILEEGLSIPGIRCSQYTSIIAYVADVLGSVLNEFSKQYLNNTIKLMELTEEDFKKLILDSILANLHFFIVVLSQIINQECMKRETYLYQINQSDDKAFVYRFRERLKPDRMQRLVCIIKEKNSLGVNKDGTEEYESVSYFTPTIISAYRNTLFVPRINTAVYDISTNFLDIFTMLMNDSNEILNKSGDKKRRRIKQHSVWDFTNTEVEFICSIYNNIRYKWMAPNSSMCDKLSQLMLLEKLYGIATITEISNKHDDKKTNLSYIECISPLVHLGYSTLHKTIINQLKIQNIKAYSAMIDYYLMPALTKSLKICLNDIILYIGALSGEKRKTFVRDIKIEIERFLDINFSTFPYVNLSKFNSLFYISCINRFAGKTKDVSLYDYMEFFGKGEMSLKYKQYFKEHPAIQNPQVYDCDIVNLTFS